MLFGYGRQGIIDHYGSAAEITVSQGRIGNGRDASDRGGLRPLFGPEKEEHLLSESGYRPTQRSSKVIADEDWAPHRSRVVLPTVCTQNVASEKFVKTPVILLRP